MVYDCFIFYNELDLLAIRLEQLDGVVDRFVIVEADRTFQNKPKPFHFEENRQRFEKYLHKIIHVKLTKYPLFIPVINPFSPWKIETFQRNSIRKGLKGCQPDDVILISDVDEIPNPETIAKAALNPLDKIYGLRMDMFMYFFNNKLVFDEGSQMDRLESKKGIWHGMVVTPYRLMRKTPNKLRRMLLRTVRKGAKFVILPNAGWHFSYIGGVDRIIQKLEAYSHNEYNKDEYKDRDAIAKAIYGGKDLFGRDLEFEVVDPVENMPPLFADADFRQRYADYFLPLPQKP